MGSGTEDLNPQEEGQNEIVELDRRYRLSLVAMDKVAQRMMTEETFTPTQAALLAATYLAYSVENWTHAARMLELRIDSGEFQTLPEELEGVELKFITSKIGVGANIIVDAQRGEYISLKRYLAEKGESLSINSQSGSRRVWSRKLFQISRRIPYRGELFKPPMPAWKNPEFSSQIPGPNL